MKRTFAVLALTFFALGFLVPAASADVGGYLHSTRDKMVRGVENGSFGMAGEMYHQIGTRRQEGIFKAYTFGFLHGLHRGIGRTLVGTYEIATPFYHDKPILSEVDALFVP